MKLILLFCALAGLTTMSIADTIRAFDIPTLEKLGNEMFEQDTRAARATDIVQEKKVNLDPKVMRGWIVTGDSTDMLVQFFGEKDGVLSSLCDVHFKGKADGVLHVHDPIPLAGMDLVQAKARLLVASDLTTVPDLCSRTHNVIILPDPDGSGLLVWAIAATTNASDVQVGGHFRYTVSQSGDAIESRDRLFRSCLVLSTKPKNMPKGASLAALSMGWIVSDTPLEIHVMLQRYAKLPFMIMTTSNGKMWEVKNGKIRSIN